VHLGATLCLDHPRPDTHSPSNGLVQFTDHIYIGFSFRGGIPWEYRCMCPVGSPYNYHKERGHFSLLGRRGGEESLSAKKEVNP